MLPQFRLRPKLRQESPKTQTNIAEASGGPFDVHRASTRRQNLSAGLGFT